jgi:hypothetical protein
VGLDVLGVALVTAAGDHLAEQAVRQVRVLECRSRLDRDLGVAEGIDDLVDRRELRRSPRGQGRLGWQPRLVQQHAPDRHAIAGAAAFRGAHELRQMRLEPIVQAKLTVVAQLEDRRGGERLGDGRDSPRGPRAWRRPGLGIGADRARRPEPHQLATLGDAQGERRQREPRAPLLGQLPELIGKVADPGCKRHGVSILPYRAASCEAATRG